MELLKDYWSFVAIRLKGQTSYRKSYLVEMLGHILFMFTHLGSIFFIFYHVKEIHGWSVWEVIYLYGLTTFSFTLVQLAAEGFEDLHLYIKSGEFDRFLLRPISPLVQIASLSFKVDRIGGVIQGIVILLIAGLKSNAFQNLSSVFFVIISIVSMAFVYYALFLANGAFCFWTLENSEAFNAFTYGGVELGKYPLSIYKGWMQSLFLYFIPLGFVGYLPTVEVFGKETHLQSFAPSGLWAPVVAFVFLGAVWCFWQFSLKHYQSTGS